MNRTNYVFIFSGKSPVILHPYDAPTAFRADDAGSVIGRYGSGNSPTDADSIRTTLYASLEKGARRHFLNKGYYIRLAMTTATFISIYVFLSIFVRDPVPLIDELLLGTLAAAAVFFASERKALSSRSHLDYVLRLRRAIDGAYFSESRVVDLVESWRDEAVDLGPASYYKVDAVQPVLSDDEKEEASALCEMLANRWKSKAIVAELYDAAMKGRVPGNLLDKAARRLGLEECALALAYIRLIPLALESVE